MPNPPVRPTTLAASVLGLGLTMIVPAVAAAPRVPPVPTASVVALDELNLERRGVMADALSNALILDLGR
ncbi:MAG: hypothetical protein AAGK32_19195, partial [Actinomycetota bacterium]